MRKKRKTCPFKALQGGSGPILPVVEQEYTRDYKTISGKGRLPERKVDVTPDLAAFKMSNMIGRRKSGAHIELHEFVGKIMACFNDLQRFTIYLDKRKFRSFFESEWIRTSNLNGRNGEGLLTHYLTVARTKDGIFVPRHVGESSQVLDREKGRTSYRIFRQSKPTLIDHREGLLLEFANLDPNSDRCAYGEVETCGRGMRAFLPMPYGEPSHPLGIIEMDGDLTPKGSRITGLARLYLTGFPCVNAAGLIADELMHTDWTTKLAGKNIFENSFKNLVRKLKRRKVSNGFLLLVDIDKFKELNTKYGLYGGDLLLGRIAEAIRESVFQVDIISRWGGDEFGVLLSGDISLQQALEISVKVKQNVENAFVELPRREIPDIDWDNPEHFEKINRTCSIGVVSVKELMDVLGCTDEELCCFEIFTQCNKMLDNAKEEGRNGIYYTKVVGGRKKEKSHTSPFFPLRILF